MASGSYTSATPFNAEFRNPNILSGVEFIQTSGAPTTNEFKVFKLNNSFAKKDSENYLIDNYNDYTIVRTGWNVGLNEKSRCPIQLTYETLLNDNAKMATDNYFSLSYVEDTAEVLYRVSIERNLNKIHICSDRIINRKEMAMLVTSVSSNRNQMSFSDCLFKEIPYSEPRGRINDLDNSLSKKLFGIKYFDAHQLIMNKVRYLDNKLK